SIHIASFVKIFTKTGRPRARATASGLSDVPGLSVASSPDSPIVFLTLKKSTSSSKADKDLLQEIADRVLKDEFVFVVTSKKSTLDRCPLPVGIRLFVSTSHSELDLLKASESLKRVAALVFECCA
ncbi:long chain base biosynthesis protein 1b-like, partial [Humulus lupulus]|uniref:long chain base biosynthesis protein 1b-like n=1 Tax=Humulus lupulus TaxID=3486 RepID=UPI002B40EE45